jgi:hypothetical protein
MSRKIHFKGYKSGWGNFIYLVNIKIFTIIHICYGYLNKIKVPLALDS